ncbi:MAG: HlyC/CorC family transporter [Kytococcus sp.]|uniref:hemolysin family protein n=1 Tax=Janibacter terrae TaxID=103817 RepID=UPI000838E51D|nr:hemolysin family protein [Janibacter terrae]MBA4084588.1 HlyC/CorC family transporter [Kytococcus sp.]
MDSTAISLALVILFVLVGGFFAGSEIALVSLRDSQVRRMEADDGRGKRVAKLRGDANRFLSAVQVGVTLTGFFASSYGGATIAVKLAPWLESVGVPDGVSDTVALVLVTALVAYLSLVLGELLPKRLALQRAEGWSLIAAPVLDRIASLTRPVIWVLGVSTNALGRLVGLDPKGGGEEVSEEELREMVSSHEELGAYERRVLTDVFDAADRRITEVMIPRTEVDFLKATMPLREAARLVSGQPHSRYPVTGQDTDDVLGFVHVRDLLTTAQSDSRDDGTRTTVADATRDVLALPGSRTVLSALAEMRRQRAHLALVIDEYGGTDGIVTMEDLLEELVGEIEDEYDPGTAGTSQLTGSTDLDGLLHRNDVKERTGLDLPEGPYETLAGFVMTRLGRAPALGDEAVALDHRFQIIDMDGRRPSLIRVEPERATGDGSNPSQGDSVAP